jgi:hypothetical protein
MNVLDGTLITLGVLAWMGVMFYLGMAIAADMDCQQRRPIVRWAAGIAAAIIFSIPFGWLLSDSSARPLCLQGHQKWTRVHGWMPIGRTFMPTTFTEKVWVCDEYEAAQ